MLIPGLASFILPAAVACQLMLLAFLSCIARLYELKFREATYYFLYLLPVFLFIALSLYSLAAGLAPEWAMLAVNACTLIVLATAGTFLYRKMTGASR